MIKLIPILFESLNEDFNIDGNQLTIKKPFDEIKSFDINGHEVYALFGDVDYYDNRESILAIKGKSDTLELNGQSYMSFLSELRKRFYSIQKLRRSDVLVSIETSSNINDDIISVIGKTSIKDGFKKNDPQFKIRGVEKSERLNLKNVFNVGFDMSPDQIICIVDDFITTGSSFRNAFEILPENVKSVGVCLFRLKS